MRISRQPLSAIFCTGLCVAPLLCSNQADAQTIAPEFVGPYTVRKLGSVPSLPESYGGMTFKAGDANTLLIGGNANTGDAKIYAVRVQRGTDGHITGFSGTSSFYAAAPGIPPTPGEPATGGIDGGLDYGPNGVLFYTSFNDNSLGQLKPGSAAPDKQTDLSALGFESSVGALAFVPAGFPGAGRLKITSYGAGKWYDTGVTADGNGTFTIGAPAHTVTFAGSPEGVFYVKAGSPKFTKASVLVGFYSENNVVAYEIDSNGDPLANTARTFITGLNGITGATRDPATGDFLFSSYTDPNVYVVGGFMVGTTEVAITSPTNNATFAAPAGFEVVASANQSGGSISRVELYQDNQLLTWAQTSPCATTVADLNPGSYAFTAVAYDSSGVATTSAVVHVTVTGTPLQVALLTPTNNTTVPACSPMVLVGQISGGSGTLSKVQFFDGTTELAQLTTPPWQFLVKHLNEGTHAFSVKATDSKGVTGLSQTANVIVQPLPLHKLAIHHLVADQLLLCFKGNAGSSYVWETTGDLNKSWTPFRTNTAPAGTLQLTNSFSSAWPPGFYRTRMVQ